MDINENPIIIRSNNIEKGRREWKRRLLESGHTGSDIAFMQAPSDSEALNIADSMNTK